MVVVSEYDGSDSKPNSQPRSTVTDSVAGSASSPISPPAYPQTISTQPFTPWEQIPPYSPPLSPEAPLLPSDPAFLERTRSNARRRFLRAFVCAFIVYMALAITFSGSVIIINIDSTTTGLGNRIIILNNKLPEGPPAGPLEEDGKIINCYPGVFSPTIPGQTSLKLGSSEPPLSKSVTFSIPSSLSLLYFLSRGQYGVGSLRFELSDKESRDIEIDITMKYHHEELLEHSQVCSLEAEDGGRGIGFFTPKQERRDSNEKNVHISFNTTIRFPRSGTLDNPFFIEHLQTNLSIWSHSIADLEEIVAFKSVSFKGAVAPVDIAGISAESVTIESGVGPIRGSFNITNSLLLKTSASPIWASVGLKATRGNEPAMFNVTAQTSVAPMTLSFVDAPASPFSKLICSVNTSLGAADVTLHPTFEGAIIQNSALMKPTLQETEGTEDPSGQGRTRTISRKRTSFASEAQVWWGEKEERGNFGIVRVETVLAANTVILG